MALMQQVRDRLAQLFDKTGEVVHVNFSSGYRANLPKKDLVDLMIPQFLVADNVIIVYLHLLESLATENWLILDPVFYTNLLGPKIPYNFPECFRQSGFQKLPRDSLVFKKIIFPCNTGLHWVLVVYDFEFNSILYFDSFWRRYPQINQVTADLSSGADRPTHPVLEGQLQVLGYAFSRVRASQTATFAKTISWFPSNTQLTDNNCGPYLLLFARSLDPRSPAYLSINQLALMDSNTVTLNLRSVFAAEILMGSAFSLPQHLNELVVPASNGSRPKVREEGFVCDRCNRQIETSDQRWHCGTCRDFDLCEQCQEQHVHPHRLHLAEQRPAAVPKAGSLVQLDISQMLGAGSPKSTDSQRNLLRELAKERQARSGLAPKKQKTPMREVIDLS